MVKERVIVARPGEEAYVTELIPNYENLSALVGGTLEMSNPFDDDVAIICDESGKIKGKMPNRLSCGNISGCFRRFLPVDVYAGTIVIVGCRPEKTEFDGLTDSEIEKYMFLYKEPQFKTGWFDE